MASGELSAVLLASTVLAVACAGCSSSSPAKSSGGCRDYASSADLTSPTVSFSADVYPIFQKSCGLGGSTCHGDPTYTGRPFLGSASKGTPQQAIQQMVGVASTELPSMNYVSPKDPAHSFLMHKMDADQCTLVGQCTLGDPAPCGSSMPLGGPPLDVSKRDTVRRWIAQGARDN